MIASFLLVAAVADAPAAPPAPERQRFTFQLGLGIGATYHHDGDRVVVRPGVAPLSLGIGWFIDPRWSVMARIGGTNYTEGRDVRMNGFYGAVAQRWLRDALYVSAGAGVGLFGIDNLKFYPSQDWSVFPDVEHDVTAGLSTSLRAGFAFANWRRHSLQLSFEVFPSFFGRSPHVVVGQSAKLEWQFF